MGEVIEFFQNLFDVSDWPPRWICGKWSEFHGWLYIISDLTIWLAYFVIPVILIWFIQQNKKLPFLPVFWLFVAFILFCGLTHALDALIFWWPAYRVSALVRFGTAIVSILTVFALIRDLPKVLTSNAGKNFDEDEQPVDNLENSHEKNYQAALLRIVEKEQEIEKLREELAQNKKS